MTTLHHRAAGVRSLLNRIERRSRLDSTIDRAALIVDRNRFLQSFDTRVTYLARRQSGCTDRALLERQAQNIDLFTTTEAPITYFEVPRHGRSPRRICSFSLHDGVAHLAAKDLIAAQFEPASHIYSWRGRGNAALICDFVRSLAGDPKYVLLADVRDCFDSINFDAIYDLDILPDPFLRANLDARNRRFERKACQHFAGRTMRCRHGVCPTCDVHQEPVVWRGLMQGSAASSALLAMLFNDLPGHLSDAVSAFVSADNIAIVAPTIEACREAEQALDCYMSNHRAGPLSLTTDFLGRAELGFEHLGYSIDWIDDDWLVHHSSQNLIRSVRRLIDREGESDALTCDRLSEVITGFPALSPKALARLVDMAVEAEWLW